METLAPWSAFRRAAARPAVTALVAMAAGAAIGLNPWALLWAAGAWVVHRRAASETLRFKVLAWGLCAATGFAMVVHMVAGQMIMGGLSAVAAVTTLFVAFLPDAADLIDNAQMTRPSKP
ncbi:hypothetical protein [Asticcacaulis solisilvae]|uniref:hypothetical protein n=1 Tax=Asticcacaulis solisilvae TaxID=1217274 RepID=UPI003FD84AF9